MIGSKSCTRRRGQHASPTAAAWHSTPRVNCERLVATYTWLIRQIKLAEWRALRPAPLRDTTRLSRRRQSCAVITEREITGGRIIITANHEFVSKVSQVVVNCWRHVQFVYPPLEDSIICFSHVTLINGNYFNYGKYFSCLRLKKKYDVLESSLFRSCLTFRLSWPTSWANYLHRLTLVTSALTMYPGKCKKRWLIKKEA